MTRSPLLALAALVAGTTGLCSAPAALADSLVFVKANDVWLASPDGSGQYQVTRDGTADQPYRSPSQADDGTIAASHGTSIVRLRQNGEVLNAMDPPPLINSVSQPVDGPPLDVVISPDGTRIAYSFVGYSCPVGASCMARAVTAVTPADHLAPSGGTYTSQSSWVTNSRLLTFAGYDHQVNTFDVGAATDVHWFDDRDLTGDGPSTDQGDGEVNRQGTFVATIRGYGADKTVMWLPFAGDVRTGSREAGTLGVPTTDGGCVTDKVADLAGPTWAPSGTALAWHEAGGIQVWPDTRDCGAGSRMLIPGGTEPDWGPAAVTPGPRSQPPGPPSQQRPPSGGRGPSGPAGSGTTTKPRLIRTDAGRLATALKRGVAVRLKGVRPGKLALSAKTGGRLVARGTGTATPAGAAAVRLSFTKAARTRLAKARTVRLTITGAGLPAGTTLTLKR